MNANVTQACARGLVDGGYMAVSEYVRLCAERGWSPYTGPVEQRLIMSGDDSAMNWNVDAECANNAASWVAGILIVLSVLAVGVAVLLVTINVRQHQMYYRTSPPSTGDVDVARPKLPKPNP